MSNIQPIDEEIWIRNPCVLFKTSNIFPSYIMPFEAQLNAVTRGVIGIWALLFAVGYKNHALFLVIGLLLIVLLYCLQRKSEGFEQQFTANTDLTCNTDSQIQMNPYFYSQNQAYVNGTSFDSSKLSNLTLNPQYSPNCNVQNADQLGVGLISDIGIKLQKPIIVPPMFASDYWSRDYMPPENINQRYIEEVGQSGYYYPTQCCNSNQTQYVVQPPPHIVNVPVLPNQPPQLPNKPQSKGQVKEGFIPPQSPQKDPIALGCTKQTYKSYGGVFNPEQLQNNLPINYPAGQCNLNPVFNEYNKNLFTTNIQPNTYFQTGVIQNLNANLGISEASQFDPVSMSRNPDGSILYQSHDKSQVQPVLTAQFPTTPNRSNVYDPRFYGYGPESRGYLDRLTGQPRFMYDDVDSVKRPNYIVRSNIDAFNWADGIGNFRSTGNNRQLADKTFEGNSLHFRNDMQCKWMNKYNTEILWQKRQMPIRQG